jgi:hypothetical protein
MGSTALMERGRASFDGSRQSSALRSLLKKEGQRYVTLDGDRTLTDLAGVLSLSYVQLWRYINGELPLRSDQFGPFARAFGVPEDDLLRRCFPSLSLQTPAPPWNPRAELEAAGVPEGEIQTVLSDIADYGFDDQRESVSAYLELHAKKHNARTRRRA